MTIIYTIGYANRKFDKFIESLKKYEIATVVDIRRFPKSKYPEYNKEFLESELLKHSIRYICMSELLGGFRGGYAKYMKTSNFKKGINELIRLAENCKVVIMCRERMTKWCHRRYIAKALENLGIVVIHI